MKRDCSLRVNGFRTTADEERYGGSDDASAAEVSAKAKVKGEEVRDRNYAD
ncbi:hypothetical protein QTP88_016344 [Uroleucon formosanum]